MVTFLGSLLGFLVSIFPEVMKYFHKKKDLSHELAVLDRQLDSMREGHFMRVQEITIQGQNQEQIALLRSVRPSKVRWIEGLSSSVRPVITYAFFLLYAAVKSAQIVAFKHMGNSWGGSLLAVWDVEDKTLFAAVLSFWFGSRAMTRGRRS